MANIVLPQTAQNGQTKPPKKQIPPMCALCGSIKRVEPINPESPEQNQCFEVRRYAENYAPFKGDRRTIPLTCVGFSHIKTAVFGLRGGGQKVFRASPEMPKIELSELGPLFDRKGE